MEKILTTIERIKDKNIFNKYFDVIKNMTTTEFDHLLWTHESELKTHYNVCQWRGDLHSRTLTDYQMGLANLLADQENLSVLRYKRLFG